MNAPIDWLLEGEPFVEYRFQAPGFYQKQGYLVFGELPGFPAGHPR